MSGADPEGFCQVRRTRPVGLRAIWERKSDDTGPVPARPHSATEAIEASPNRVLSAATLVRRDLWLVEAAERRAEWAAVQRPIIGKLSPFVEPVWSGSGLTRVSDEFPHDVTLGSETSRSSLHPKPKIRASSLLPPCTLPDGNYFYRCCLFPLFSP